MISLQSLSYYDETVSFSLHGKETMQLSVRRFDRLHPEISGNKWFKLQDWLSDLVKDESVLSFGGAYSNHLLALSAAGKELGIKTIGIVRGEEVDNPWISSMRKNGMLLYFVSRESYRLKKQDSFLNDLQEQFGHCRIIPEGGAGSTGIDGAMGMVNDVELYDWIALPGGTGTSAAGIAKKLQKGSSKILCFQVLKGDSIIKSELKATSDFDVEHYPNLRIDCKYHFGGYAKSNEELRMFQKQWIEQTSIPIDLIYGSKALYGLYDKFQMGLLGENPSVLYIHTGGLGPIISRMPSG
jgi:1-aminocyclopropane-1-carboxylate deaminase/D-cysteine desulfhydrase-like pyridoxal-dependent ACC family enzyme